MATNSKLLNALLDPVLLKAEVEDLGRAIDSKKRQVESDRKALAAKQLEARSLAERLASEEESLRELERVYEALRTPAGLPPRSGATPGSVADAAIRILKEENRPMRGREVHKALAALGRHAPLDSVNWSLWDAERRRLVQKVGKGLYASLDYSGAESE